MEILLHYRLLFIKGDVFISEWGIFGAEVFLHYSQFFVKGNFIIGGVECTIEPTTVVPRKLTSLIIVEFHNVKGHQGIGNNVNMVRHYFWLVGMQRHSSAYQQLPVMYQFSVQQVVHPAHASGNTTSTLCRFAMDCIGPLSTSYKGNRHALTYLLVNIVSYYMSPKE